MINTFLTFTALLLNTAAMTLSASTNEYADAGGWAVTSIINNTGYTLNYSVQWGNGNWQNCSLEPGACMYHYYETTSNQISPILNIEFDADLTAWTYTKRYTLLKNFSYYANCESGSQYCFQAAGNYVDLYKR